MFARQLWLAKINRACRRPEGQVTPVPDQVPVVTTRIPPRQQCPRWPWDVSVDQYTWQFQNDDQTAYSTTKVITETNFRTFLRFSNTLRWRIGDGFACSVFELAVLAFHHGWRFELPAGIICTVQAYAATIRAAISYCKAKHIVVAPLLLQKGNKCNGKTYPKGAFVGAEAFLGNVPLEMLCRAFEKGAMSTPASWTIPFDSLL